MCPIAAQRPWSYLNTYWLMEAKALSYGDSPQYEDSPQSINVYFFVIFSQSFFRANPTYRQPDKMDRALFFHKKHSNSCSSSPSYNNDLWNIIIQNHNNDKLTVIICFTRWCPSFQITQNFKKCPKVDNHQILPLTFKKSVHVSNKQKWEGMKANWIAQVGMHGKRSEKEYYVS